MFVYVIFVFHLSADFVNSSSPQTEKVIKALSECFFVGFVEVL